MKLNLTNKILEGLTIDQKDALQFLKEFIESNKTIAVISGGPGTGKTYLMDRFNRSVNCLLGISAPTHRAKVVLESRLGVKGKTIQSLLGLRPNMDLVDFNIDNLIFEPLVPPEIQNYQVVVIDECSMLTKGIIKLTEKLAELHGVKIIYVGDRKQLPPVIKNVNIVEEPFVFTEYVDNMFELKEVVRQEIDNPLLDLIIACGNDIDYGTRSFESILKNERIKYNSKFKGYAYINRESFKKNIIKEYVRVGEKNINYIRTLAYTNNNVSYWNGFLRDNLLGNDLDVLNINDILTSYSTISDKFGANLITNSNDYLIHDLKHMYDTNGLKIFKLKLIDCITNEVNSKFIKVVDHTDEKTFEAYYKKLSILHNDALKTFDYNRKKAWSEYYKFKDKYLSLKTFKLNSGNEMAKDLDYGYSITVHKSQGGTFDRIALDLPDINSVKNEELRRRLIYVGLSRAKDVVYLSM